jgi:hypothetical protein
MITTIIIVNHVAYSTALLERAGDLIMVSIEAAGAGEDTRTTVDAGGRATHRVHLALTEAPHGRGALRDRPARTSPRPMSPMDCAHRTCTGCCVGTGVGRRALPRVDRVGAAARTDSLISKPHF